MVNVLSFQRCGAQTTLAQEQPYAAEHCLDEESTIVEVLVVSTGYDQGVFPISSCDTPYLPAFLEARYTDKPS